METFIDQLSANRPTLYFISTVPIVDNNLQTYKIVDTNRENKSEISFLLVVWEETPQAIKYVCSSESPKWGFLRFNI